MIPCNIHLYQKKIRRRFFCEEGNFPVQVWRWRCSTHQKKIQLTDVTPPDNVMTFIDNVAVELLILPRSIITMNLWKFILTLYLENHNTAMVSRVITERWHTQLDALIRQV
jgi:hypothetical protein